VQPDRGLIEIQLLRDGDEAFELSGVKRRRSDRYRSFSLVNPGGGATGAAIVEIVARQ
jgi:hypothetical protein